MTMNVLLLVCLTLVQFYLAVGTIPRISALYLGCTNGCRGTPRTEHIYEDTLLNCTLRELRCKCLKPFASNCRDPNYDQTAYVKQCLKTIRQCPSYLLAYDTELTKTVLVCELRAPDWRRTDPLWQWRCNIDAAHGGGCPSMQAVTKDFSYKLLVMDPDGQIRVGDYKVNGKAIFSMASETQLVSNENSNRNELCRVHVNGNGWYKVDEQCPYTDMPCAPNRKRKMKQRVKVKKAKGKRA